MSKLGLMMSAAILAAVVSTAAQARELHVYNWSDYISEDAVPNFIKESGIKTTYDVFDSQEVVESKLTAGKSGYDLVVTTLEPFTDRQIKAGLYQKIDKSKIPNLKNLDPEILKLLSKTDPGNDYAVPWMWGTTGIGYNSDKITKILPTAPIWSLSLIFDPAIVAKFKGCGVELLDSPTDVIPAVLKYLGRDPNSQTKEDLDAATEHMLKIRPFIRKFHSSEYINDLATGNACLTFGYSGDVLQAAARAKKANKGVEVVYNIPSEGALFWVDSFVLPKDATNVLEAHEFLDYVLRPDVGAASATAVGYATPNAAAVPLISKDLTSDPTIFPPAEVRARFYTISVPSQEYDRLRTRAWTKVKTGR